MRTYSLAVGNIIVVGCGGVASWLMQPLIRVVKGHGDPLIHLVDGDVLEEKNLERQLFNELDIGKKKSVALAARYEVQYPGLEVHDDYLIEGMDFPAASLWLCCADNHAARRLTLSYVDQLGGRAIIGGNEYTDAEAYIYDPAWKETALDPRVYYPEILTDEAGDPTRPQTCQGMAAIANPQLVLANQQAAGYMSWLIWFHYVQRFTMDRESTYPYWPVLHANNFSRFRTENVSDKMAAHERRTKPKAVPSQVAVAADLQPA